ncbi:MAG: divergent polysaccharide deacetylase family protein [Alphaproteobacteria bacterium]
MTEQPSGLFKTAIKDPAVRLAALGGALAGAVLVLVVVMLSGGGHKDTPAAVQYPPAQQGQVAAIVTPAPRHVTQSATAPEMAEPAATLAPDNYPSLPVARVEKPESAAPALPESPLPVTEQVQAPDAVPDVAAVTPLPEAAPPPLAAKPMIAIVIDDMGVDQRRSARAMKLPAKVTLSFLPYARDLKKQSAEAAAMGHEVMLHVAMEPESSEADPGPNVLLTGTPEAELLANLRWNLDQMTGYQGINNHMGSRFTRDLAGMRLVMGELKARGLFFLDSLTSRDSVGAKTAREAEARKRGIAIAIGHPRDITLRALKTWLTKVQADGFELVGVSRVLHRPAPAHTGLPGTSG